MNRKTKWSHRLLALALAAVMCCSVFPVGAFAETPLPQESTVATEEQQTDETETDNGQTDASNPDPGATTEESAAPTTDEPAEENEPYTFDGEILYADMPDAPTGSYIGSYGLPVATGEIKIGLSAWDADLEQDSYLSAEALDSDNLTLTTPLLEDTDYAIVPILAQVEYPADGSTLDLILPDGVTLLDYYGAPAENAESLLHNEYSETSAAVLGVYVQADADFTAQLVYTAPDGSCLTKTLQVTMVQNEIKMRKPKSRELIHALVQDWRLYVLLLPVVLWFALWAYKPMGGLLIAFKRYDSSLGIWMSEFKGIDNFVNLVAGVNKEQFWQAFRNTFVINAYSLVFGFPVPIILAVLFSEIGNGFVRKATQTATYLPHFLSEVTITGITIMLVYSGVHSTGVLAALFQNMGWLEEGVSMLSKANYFRPLYIAVGIWKESGYSSIVYFAAIMGISPTLYEAMKVDGANKLQELRYVTFPGMAPTLIIMIIMRIGNMLSIGYERVLLMYNSNVYVTADVLSTFEQRIGILSANYGMGASVSLFNSLIAFALVIGANSISRNISDTSLW